MAVNQVGGTGGQNAQQPDELARAARALIQSFVQWNGPVPVINVEALAAQAARDGAPLAEAIRAELSVSEQFAFGHAIGAGDPRYLPLDDAAEGSLFLAQQAGAPTLERAPVRPAPPTGPVLAPPRPETTSPGGGPDGRNNWLRGLGTVGIGLVINERLQGIAGPAPIYQSDMDLGGGLGLTVYGGA